MHEQDGALVKVDHPERFPMVTVSRRATAPELSVTGVVGVDVARSVPVVSMASGRIVEIRARLGDTVKKGQLLMRVQSADLSEAFSDYRQAMADEKLANAQLARSKVLFDKGAIAQKRSRSGAGDRGEGGRRRRNRRRAVAGARCGQEITPRRLSTYWRPPPA